MSDYHGSPTSILENEFLRLEYLTSTGPRIVSLSYQGSPNLFAEVPEIFWDTPLGKYFPMGGHRLWISPELPEKTYIPDQPGLEVVKIPGGVELTGVTEPGSGVQKKIQIVLDEKEPVIRIVHTIQNENSEPVTFAPWAISMFRQGGIAILPQPVGNADPNGLLHNRVLVLWPYTSFTDPRLGLGDDYILVDAVPSLPPLKLGFMNSAGWLAYWLDGILFKKTFPAYQPGLSYPDGGCNAETYCNDRFVELESVGPLSTLGSGASVQWTEKWELYPDLSAPVIPKELHRLLVQKKKIWETMGLT
jgi:hypothetical protein